MDRNKVYLEVPKFTGENVPVSVVARVMKKDQQFIRQGIIPGFLKFGGTSYNNVKLVRTQQNQGFPLI